MKRYASDYLDQWIREPNRKPLILRGARQVGKTWIVRDLAQRHGLKLVELNMERRPELADHFRSNDAPRAISDLSAELGTSIQPDTSLLFIDEVQATPQLLPFLRWFREDIPELPVIAAGSLLDFALRGHEFSMPVGRITYCYLEPLSFYEFLDASGDDRLKSSLAAAAESLQLGPRLHQRALELFSEYCLVGGLPEVVADWIAARDDNRRLQLQRDLITTYRDDFNRYRGRISADLLRHVMDAIPRQLASRFVYSHVDADAKHRDIKRALELLQLARVCHRVEHTAANGLPLGAETNPRTFKSILVDVGLASVQLGLSRLDPSPSKAAPTNPSLLAEPDPTPYHRTSPTVLSKARSENSPFNGVHWNRSSSSPIDVTARLAECLVRRADVGLGPYGRALRRRGVC